VRNWIVAIATAALLVAVNLGIASRERLVEHGRTVLLELAPIDPRSFMQGDYMALRFAAADGALTGGAAQRAPDGRLVLAIDARGVATFRRIDTGAPLAGDEVLVRYRIRNGQPWIATNAYFFEERRAGDYAKARYGEFRVAADGDAILTGLRDAQLARLGTPPR
jgi:uncharacterized membrane-anchored protein